MRWAHTAASGFQFAPQAIQDNRSIDVIIAALGFVSGAKTALDEFRKAGSTRTAGRVAVFMDRMYCKCSASAVQNSTFPTLTDWPPLCG
jgi:hypothetical protein